MPTPALLAGPKTQKYIRSGIRVHRRTVFVLLYISHLSKKYKRNMPGARLGASVYTFTVGDALERKQITDPDALRNMVATGKLDTTLAPMDGSVKPGGLPRAMHRKYYKSMSGFCDTPKEVVEGIKRSLCEFDDVVSRCAPQTVVSFFLYYAAKLFCFFLLWVTYLVPILSRGPFVFLTQHCIS